MSAYFILFMAVPERPELLGAYRQLGRTAFEGSGGRFIVLPGGEMDCVEGDSTASVVVVEFSDMEQARAFYNSRLYQDAVKMRLKAVASHAVLVQGVDAT